MTRPHMRQLTKKREASVSLYCETLLPLGRSCTNCGYDKPVRLHSYVSVRDGVETRHDGLFCCASCHHAYHGWVVRR